MKFGKIPIFSHKISDGKKGGPLPKINNGRTKSKNNNPKNKIEKDEGGINLDENEEDKENKEKKDIEEKESKKKKPEINEKKVNETTSDNINIEHEIKTSEDNQKNLLQ